MAIKIVSFTGKTLLQKVGVSEDTLNSLAAAGVKPAIISGNLILQNQITLKPYASVQIGWDKISQLKANKLAPTDLQILKANIEAACKDALYAAGVAASTVASTKAEKFKAGFEAGVISKLPPLKLPSKEKPKALAEASGWPMFDLAKLKTAPTVKLRDATMMYQPVMGTSTGSRYYLVAANKDVRIAARYIDKGGQLSLRIEGPNWSQYTDKIQACGITKIESDYASIHLNCGGDFVLANKTLGALLLGLGIQFETPLPDLKVIAK